MAIKVVILFQQVTQPVAAQPGVAGIIMGGQVLSAPSIGYNARQHIAGWTEYVMYNSDNIPNLMTALQSGANNQPGLLPARAALLPTSATIIGVRLYQGGAGKGQSFAFSYNGPANYEGDNPSQALLVKVGNVSVAVARRFTLRGLPDPQVTGGEFTPTPDFVTAVNNWMHALSNFAFRAIDPASPSAAVFNITAAGLVTLVGAANPFLVNQMVTINSTLDATGIRRNFKGQVATIGPNQNQFTLTGPWPWGITTGGRATSKNIGIFSMDYNTMNVARMVQRRVGRPFELYRGRRSRRHK